MMKPYAPAPASDETLAAAPAYIADGTWDDPEWRAAAAKPQGTMTEAEQYLYAGGPRPHPWGGLAHTGKLADGSRATFPSRAAYDAHVADEAAGQAKADTKAQGALNALNSGLAAHAKKATPKPASDPGQADAMKEAAAPHGSVAG